MDSGYLQTVLMFHTGYQKRIETGATGIAELWAVSDLYLDSELRVAHQHVRRWHVGNGVAAAPDGRRATAVIAAVIHVSPGGCTNYATVPAACTGAARLPCKSEKNFTRVNAYRGPRIGNKNGQENTHSGAKHLCPEIEGAVPP